MTEDNPARPAADRLPGIEPAEKILESPRLLEYRAFELNPHAEPQVLHMGISVMRGFTSPEDTARTLQHFRTHPALADAAFPFVDLIAAQADPDKRIVVGWNWMHGSSLARLTAVSADLPVEDNVAFAFYVLRELGRALQALHTVQVGDRNAVHGAITPEGIWIDPDGNVQLHNHLYGIAMELDNHRYSDEHDDVRGLVQIFSLVVLNRAAVPTHLDERLPEPVAKFLKKWALSESSGETSLHKFLDMISKTIEDGRYMANQETARRWLNARESVFRDEIEKLARTGTTSSARDRVVRKLPAHVQEAVSELATLAERAWSERRLKDCLATTRTLQKLDPDNSTASSLQAGVQQELARQLAAATAQLQAAASNNDPDLCDRAIRGLRTVQNIDPSTQNTSTLLLEAEAVAASLSSIPRPSMLPAPVPELASPGRNRNLALAAVGAGLVLVMALVVFLPEILGTETGTVQVSADTDVEIHVDGNSVGSGSQDLELEVGPHQIEYRFNDEVIARETVTVESGKPARNILSRQLAQIEILSVPAFGLRVSVDGKAPQPAGKRIAIAPGKRTLRFGAEGYLEQELFVEAVSGQNRTLTVLLQPGPSTTAAPPPAARSAPVPPRPAAPGGAPVRPPTQPAVSSPPPTLPEPRPEIVVDINVRPWAEVFVDGPAPSSLGQTPLARVRVPVGSTLIFRNPRFAEMRFQVAADTKSIDLAFP